MSVDFPTSGYQGSVENGIYCEVVEQRVSAEDCEDLTREDRGVQPGAAAFNVPDTMSRGQTVTVHLVVDRRSPRLIGILEVRADAGLPTAGTDMNMDTNMTDGADTNVIGDNPNTNSTTANGDGGTGNAAGGEEAGGEEDASPTPKQIVNELEGRPDSFNPLVGRHMRAELIGQGFDIVARSEPSQDIRLGGNATWIWDVTAREGGSRSLTVVTLVEGVANGRRFVLARTPKVRTVTVNVSWSDWAMDWLVAAPVWIKAVTAVIVALGGLLTAWYAVPWFRRRGGDQPSPEKEKEEDSGGKDADGAE